MNQQIEFDGREELVESSGIFEVPKGFIPRNFRRIDSGSLRGIVLFWIKLAMGSGSFMFPYFFMQFGIMGGVTLTFIVATLNYFCCNFVFEANAESRTQTYTELVEHWLGTVD